MRPNLSTVTLMVGFYLIIEATASFLFLSDDNAIFQLGRLIRIIIGLFIILVELKAIK